MNDGPEVRFSVRVTPRAGGDAIVGVEAGVLRVRVAAPPVEGAANVAILRAVAEALGLPVGSVRLVRGARSRDKVIGVTGRSTEAITARWPDLGVSSPPGRGPRSGGHRAIGSVG